MLNGAAISWMSKKQNTVALSWTEAEDIALTQAVKESIWLQGILRDLGARRHMEEMKRINVDNQGAIALARNPKSHSRSKHIDIQYLFIREHVENQKIALFYCPTADMTADIFTKALPYPSFLKHNLGLGLIDQSAFILAEPTGPTLTRTQNPNHGSDQEQNQAVVTTGEGWYWQSPVLTPCLP